jgi:hypothetical protein
MLSISRVIQFLWVFTILLFLAFFFYGYYLLPDVVCVRFTSNGMPDLYWDRTYLFYVFAGALTVFNVLFLAIEKVLGMVPISLRIFPNKAFWTSSEENVEAVGFIGSNWLYSFMSILNMSILAVFGVFWKVNFDVQSNILNYGWVTWLILSVLGVWIVYLPIRLFISKVFIQ